MPVAEPGPAGGAAPETTVLHDARSITFVGV